MRVRLAYISPLGLFSGIIYTGNVIIVQHCASPRNPTPSDCRSNIFAILGLRALYFCLAAAMHMFYYLPYALSLILVFIGAKMLAAFALGFHIPIEVPHWPR